MDCYIELRRVADSWGLVSQNGKGIPFKTRKKARNYAREHCSGRYVAEWRIITKEQAEKDYNI